MSKALIEGADYFIYVVDFPDATVGGAVKPNEDGTYSVYLNTRCTYEKQRESLAHELSHIDNDDFHNGKPICDVERI